ncbi:restriction endonuclease [Amphibacillus sp. Q70]|uniref:restriction endonuclease n=1 Tax=Amphibacillus sp. Q70 TaxID=3453416 RepID=UPI003F8543AA
MKETFEELSRSEQSNILKPEIIKILRELGGIASRKEIINELKTTSENIPEEYIDYRKQGKNGKLFSPFVFPFNFSIKEFELAGFLITPKRGYVELTEKGRTFNINDTKSLLQEVKEYADPYWGMKNKERRERQLESNQEDSDQETEETEEEMIIESWKNNLRNALENMSPQKFEIFARALVKEMGVDIDEKIGIQSVADEGLDGFGYITADDFRTSRVAIQAKRWKGSVPSPEIDKFRGAMDKYNAEYGIFITTSVFSRPAIKASREGTRVITLIDGEKITDLVEKYELYVQKVETYKLDAFFTDID